MYKVFFKNKALILKEGKRKDYSFIEYLHEFQKLKKFLKNFEESDKNEIEIIHSNLSELWNSFKFWFKEIQAAGGIIKNKENKILFIYRLNKWDLPKGKLKKGESIEECALREVGEECGLSDLKIIKNLEPTYHIYKEKKKLILKKTFWFEMFYEGDKKPIPQLEENITEVRWFDKNEFDLILKNTYLLVKEIVEKL